MSIKVKAMPPPPEDHLPPYTKDTPCWGCGWCFDFTELRAGKHGLCDHCWKVVTR